MRKIDKRVCIATEYEKWVNNLTKIPIYRADYKYYKDIFMALLYCQNGLCAYTEMRLVESEVLQELLTSFNANGKFEGERPECDADVEHFDSSKKTVNGWDWHNLFVVYDSINRNVKRVREPERGIDEILKPDSSDYEPFRLLSYDANKHIFYANEELNDQNSCEKIENMIYVLGLNYASVKLRRKEYLEILWEKQQINASILPHQFVTAYEMSKI